MGLTTLIAVAVYLLMFRSRWGLQVRAVVLNRTMAGAVGISTERVDRMTFGIGCGIAGVAAPPSPWSFHGADRRQLYIVDTFLVVVFGGAASLAGTIASAFTISQAQSTMEFFMSAPWQGAHAAGGGRHPDAAPRRPLRPQGPSLRSPTHVILAAFQGSRRRSPPRRVLVVCAAAVLEPFRLNMVGKYLTYAFVAVGLVLCWGMRAFSPRSGRVLRPRRLLHGHVSEAGGLHPEATKISPRRHSGFHGLEPAHFAALLLGAFKSLGFSIIAVMLVPAVFALVLAFALFKRRVGGVYFAIITQALAAIMSILIIGQQGYTAASTASPICAPCTAGTIRTDSAKFILYFVNAGLLIGVILLCQFVQRSKLGRILVAMRDKEDRVRFSGYDVASFKIFVFCFAAALAGIGGPCSRSRWASCRPPSSASRPPSRWSSTRRGRASVVLGAVYGTLLVNWAKTSFSESFPELWLFASAASSSPWCCCSRMAWPASTAPMWNRASARSLAERR